MPGLSIHRRMDRMNRMQRVREEEKNEGNDTTGECERTMNEVSAKDRNTQRRVRNF